MEADNKTEFFLLDVIAHTLSHLKKKVKTSLGGELRPELHIDWVITVPAIWDAAGKQVMREAGYKVPFYYYYGIWTLTFFVLFLLFVLVLLEDLLEEQLIAV